MGSKNDLTFARKIEEFIKQEGFNVNCEYLIASAHRNPDYLLQRLDENEKKGEVIVYVTIAGLSDALSGVTAGFTTRPVIACPPDIEKYGLMKVFSSVMTPKGVPVMLVSNPENAALAAIKILALNNSLLCKEIAAYNQKKRKEVMADSEVGK
ncbi:AIR carboxylase family protein [Candidatus Bathyarchaeota archaeon]|nr:AIR carboxylase family protein [Candidatus Bathyarchaeota archaeon]